MAKSSRLKKKKWCQIIAPKLFNEKILGETFVLDPSLIIGRHISSNLMDLTGDPNKQNVSITFKASELKGDNISASVTGYSISSSHIKRIVYRGGQRIDESFLAKTSDNKVIRIKPFLFARTQIKGSVSNSLRKSLHSLLLKEISKKNFETLLSEIITNRLQRMVKDSLRKVYPLRACEIKSLKIETRKKYKQPEIKEEPKKKPKEEKKADENAKTDN